MNQSSIWAALSFCLGCTSAGRDAPQRDTPVQPPSPSASASPYRALDELDRRQPLPLLPMMAQHQKENMREHLEAVQEVVAAAAVGDFAKVAVAAKRMGYSEAMGRMCEHMGAGAPGFSEQALSFHHSADEISAAATKQDGPAVLSALSKTLGVCTGCHRTFKQRLVASLPE